MSLAEVEGWFMGDRILGRLPIRGSSIAQRSGQTGWGDLSTHAVQRVGGAYGPEPEAVLWNLIFGAKERRYRPQEAEPPGCRGLASLLEDFQGRRGRTSLYKSCHQGRLTALPHELCWVTSFQHEDVGPTVN